jgi:transcriptional regulator with XRE-family HTH domain
MPTPKVTALLQRLKDLRQRSGLSAAQVEERLILGPGWVDRFESGATVPTLDMLLAILDLVGANPDDLFSGIAATSAGEIERHIHAVEDGKDLLVHFRYAAHDAVYRLPNATLEEFESVLKELRDGLARLALPRDPEAERAIKTGSVARAFLRAVKTWPAANPSDLWWFLISRAFCDSFNHPAEFARLDLGQSWKRTGGWALEEVLVRNYAPFLKEHGINLFIAHGEHKKELLKQFKIRDRFEAAKVDVLLSADVRGKETCFGVVHVKASFAERRTDDVPLSRSLIEAGYTSPLWTFDGKGAPGATPFNAGELGEPLKGKTDRRSAKRKDIEEDGYFSACFSYNLHTAPTPASQKAKARVIVCDFRNSDDQFSRFIRQEWERFRTARGL